MTDIDVTASGPVFDGRAVTAAREATEHAVREISQHAKGEVLMQLGTVLRHPTGYYESRIEDHPVSATESQVIGDKVIYGAWLEGVGSRNFPKTRFRGYHTFRIVTQRVDKAATALAEGVVRRFLPRMN